MNDTATWLGILREAASALSCLRARPCLVLSAPLQAPTLLMAREALGEVQGDLDLLLRSPGGCPCCAYLIARELQRRAGRVGVLVPLTAKSAATVLALAADELVLGDLGELGPLDAQFSDKQRADFPVDRSRLDIFKALDELRKHAVETFDELVRTVVEHSGMRAEDACRIGTAFAAGLCQPLYAQIDPLVLGESLRSMEVGAAYARRLLQRYRPELWNRIGPEILDRLVRGYPTHNFVIDREELEELGVPARTPDAEEAPFFEAIATALQQLPETEAFVELLTPSEPAEPEAADGGEDGVEPEMERAAA